MATATTSRPPETQAHEPAGGGTRGPSLGRRAGAYAGLLLLTVLFISPLVFMVTTNTITGRSPGRVTLRNCCQRLAPSTLAASYSSLGMSWSPAR